MEVWRAGFPDEAEVMGLLARDSTVGFQVVALEATHFMGTWLPGTGPTETGMAAGIMVIGITALFATIASSLGLDLGFMAGVTRTTGITRTIGTIPTIIRTTTRTTILTRTTATTPTTGSTGLQPTATGHLLAAWIPRYNSRSRGAVIIGD